MNDPKAWYYRGLVYGSLDTTPNEAYKALAPDAFTVAMESFKKADELNGKERSCSYRMRQDMPILKSQQIDVLG